MEWFKAQRTVAIRYSGSPLAETVIWAFRAVTQFFVVFTGIINQVSNTPRDNDIEDLSKMVRRYTSDLIGSLEFEIGNLHKNRNKEIRSLDNK